MLALLHFVALISKERKKLRVAHIKKYFEGPIKTVVRVSSCNHTSMTRFCHFHTRECVFFFSVRFHFLLAYKFIQDTVLILVPFFIWTVFSKHVYHEKALGSCEYWVEDLVDRHHFKREQCSGDLLFPIVARGCFRENQESIKCEAPTRCWRCKVFFRF